MSEKRAERHPSLEQLQAELEREKYRGRYGKTLRSTIYTLIVVAAIAVLLPTIFFSVFRVYNSSMTPTIEENDIVVALKGSKFRSGDIVMLNFSNKYLVKRVIATPGQWVDIDEEGNVYVDEIKLDEPYLQELTAGDYTTEFPYQVPDERYFVLSDNRSTSQDSRNAAVGCIAKDQIIGRVFLRVWPFEKIGRLKRFQ